MRGEHLSRARSTLSQLGSSPHARGALPSSSASSFSSGIIPACAGSTATSVRHSASAWDHPRMRGEHFDRKALDATAKGSSPHARGALVNLTRLVANLGIIPACAGSTLRRMGRGRGGRDHPRMRGEHADGLSRGHPMAGSSPHARGARTRKRPRNRTSGIIPACAGSTCHRR